MEHISVKIISTSRHPLPEYATPSAAGMDVRAFLDQPMTLMPMQRALIPTGLRIELPEGFECQLRPRSGLALKHGITLVNTPGTIDSDYRGEIGVIMINLSDRPFVINDGERICQMVFTRHAHADWSVAAELSDTERGDGGFGHTGVS